MGRISGVKEPNKEEEDRKTGCRFALLPIWWNSITDHRVKITLSTFTAEYCMHKVTLIFHRRNK